MTIIKKIPHPHGYKIEFIKDEKGEAAMNKQCVRDLIAALKAHPWKLTLIIVLWLNVIYINVYRFSHPELTETQLFLHWIEVR